MSLRPFLAELRRARELVDIPVEVDPCLELAEIHRRIAAEEGPALFFPHVKGSPFPVVTNLFGSRRRIEIAFPPLLEAKVARALSLILSGDSPTLRTLWHFRKEVSALRQGGKRWVARAPVTAHCLTPPRLDLLPLLKLWPEDGGSFVTLPLVYTEPPSGKGAPNLGIYRLQRYTPTTTGLHFQIQKGGGFHYHQAEAREEPLPVTIFLGGSPILMLSAIAPLPENSSELLFCALLQGERLACCRSPHTPHPLLAEAEFALVGEAKPHLRHPEGPFGDHYGYYSLTHPFPLFECKALYHRKDAIYPATVVGKPKQEDFYLGEYLQELLAPLLPVTMPGVEELWSYGEGGFHTVAAVRVRERYERECMRIALRILGEGQLSLTKFLFITDQPVDLRHFRAMLEALLSRFTPERDLLILPHLSLDTLDYTGPSLNRGSRALFLGIGAQRRTLPRDYRGSGGGLAEVIPFLPGVLVLSGRGELPPLERLLEEPSFQAWPLLFLVDNAREATASDLTLLWTLFTRCEPDRDLHARKRIIHNHLSYEGPLLFDARKKEGYPPEVESDPETSRKVTARWSSYFPQGKTW